MKNIKLLSILASITTLLILLFLYLLANKPANALESEHIYPEIHKIKGENSEITITWPEPQNLSTTIKNRITHITSYHNIAGEPLQATEHFYAKCQCGVVGSTYQIHHDAKNILSLSISVDRLGAYPSTTDTHHSFNLKTGYELRAEEIFEESKIDKLVKITDERLQENIEIARQEAEKQNWDLSADSFKHEFTKKNINNFILTDKGITFFYNFDFPHATKAAEPKSDIAFTYEELKDFFLPDGLLESKAPGSNKEQDSKEEQNPEKERGSTNTPKAENKTNNSPDTNS